MNKLHVLKKNQTEKGVQKRKVSFCLLFFFKYELRLGICIALLLVIFISIYYHLLFKKMSIGCNQFNVVHSTILIIIL